MSFNLTYDDVVVSVWNRHKALYPMDGYPAIVSLHGMARFAIITKNDALMNEIKQIARPFIDGKVENAYGFYGKTVYRCGGNLSAFLAARGLLPAEDIPKLVKFADSLCTEQPRAANRVFQKPSQTPGIHWIDSVFGVCPFLIWLGIAAKRQDFIDEACFQMKMHHELLFDKKIKLYHQVLNSKGDGLLTEAHWSRGSGWAALTLAEMVYEIPPTHSDYPVILKMYRDLMEGCLASQGEDGMWRQSMETPDTYPESSGTALIAYGMGRGIKNGTIANEKYNPAFIKAVKALTRYVTLDGSVFHCCKACTAPKDGSIADYAAHPWILNDHHAFGPIIMAFGEARHLCPKYIKPLGELLGVK